MRPPTAFEKAAHRLALPVAAALTVMLTTVSVWGVAPPAVAEPAAPANLSGVWTNASLTRLTRPEGIEALRLSPEEAQALAAGHFHNVRAAQDAEVSDPERGAPEKLERLPPVGNYSANWVDPGTRYGVVNGEIRSSWLTHPADGQLPLNERAQGLAEERRQVRARLDGPEALSPGERCLIGFGGSGGPPMLNVLYNNFYRFVQTPDHLVILVEMVHDARIIPIVAKEDANPPQAQAQTLRWLGNARATWEGDTLVIRSTGFHPARELSGPVRLSPTAEVVERLRRVDADTLYYGFEIRDPTLYTDVLRGEMSFERRDQRVYEYACHEGNYAMGGMLRGARLAEREADGE